MTTEKDDLDHQMRNAIVAMEGSIKRLQLAVVSAKQFLSEIQVNYDNFTELEKQCKEITSQPNPEE